MSSGRAVLALVTLALGVGGVVAGIVMATEGAARVPDPVAVAPVVDRSMACPDTGEWVTPERGSVGLPPGAALCAHAGGPVVIDRPGAVLDGWDLRGGVLITAPGVTVQRSRITGDGSTPYGISTRGAGTVRVQDTTITGRFTEAALGGDRWTAESVEIVGVAGDRAHAGAGCRLIASTLSRFEPGADVDGVEVRSGDVRVEDSTVRMGSGRMGSGRMGSGRMGSGRMGSGHRSAIRVDPAPGDGPVLLLRNVLGGGAYTVAQPAAGPAPVELVDNRFARDARDGPLRVAPSTRQEGSTYLDGAPVPP